MTRHQRNATAGCVYTYHERKKDAASSGYGTDHARLGKDSVKDFDCCCLSLQPCKNPVLTPDGYLYDKEAILEYILHKKKEIEQQMKEYERQCKKQKAEEAAAQRVEHEKKLQSFMASEKSISNTPTNSSSDEPPSKKTKLSNNNSAPSTSDGRSISNMNEGKNRELPSFWIPSHTPSAKATEIKKPDKTVYCPMSKKPLKMKYLIPIEFTPVEKNSKEPMVAKEVRYMCAVTHDVLSNSVPCAALKTSGKVVTLECLEKLIRKDMIDPTNGKKLTESDIIPIKGGTGFAGSGVDLNAKKARPVMMAS